MASKGNHRKLDVWFCLLSSKTYIYLSIIYVCSLILVSQPASQLRILYFSNPFPNFIMSRNTATALDVCFLSLPGRSSNICLFKSQIEYTSVQKITTWCCHVALAPSSSISVCLKMPSNIICLSVSPRHSPYLYIQTGQETNHVFSVLWRVYISQNITHRENVCFFSFLGRSSNICLSKTEFQSFHVAIILFLYQFTYLKRTVKVLYVCLWPHINISMYPKRTTNESCFLYSIERIICVSKINEYEKMCAFSFLWQNLSSI